MHITLVLVTFWDVYLEFLPRIMINIYGSKLLTILKLQVAYHVFSMRAFNLVAWGGIEPPTQGFSILCSTD